MGDRAQVHTTIGGKLPRQHLGRLVENAAEYYLSAEWDGPAFAANDLVAGEPLHLYGMDLNGGQIDDVDAFCIEHGLVFRRWSGGCPGAFLPEIVIFDGNGQVRDYTASEDEYVVFSPADIARFTRLRDLKRAIERAEITIPPFEIV